MTEAISIEQSVVNNLRSLPLKQQQEVLGFVNSLWQEQLTVPPQIKSLKQLSALPLKERHQFIMPLVTVMAEDFLTDPELTEFAVLDGEDLNLE